MPRIEYDDKLAYRGRCLYGKSNRRSKFCGKLVHPLALGKLRGCLCVGLLTGRLHRICGRGNRRFADVSAVRPRIACTRLIGRARHLRLVGIILEPRRGLIIRSLLIEGGVLGCRLVKGRFRHRFRRFFRCVVRQVVRTLLRSSLLLCRDGRFVCRKSFLVFRYLLYGFCRSGVIEVVVKVFRKRHGWTHCNEACRRKYRRKSDEC